MEGDGTEREEKWHRPSRQRAGKPRCGEVKERVGVVAVRVHMMKRGTGRRESAAHATIADNQVDVAKTDMSDGGSAATTFAGRRQHGQGSWRPGHWTIFS